MILVGASDPRSLGSWCLKGTDESTLVTDSSVFLMHHDPSNLGSSILVQITPKEHTLIHTIFSPWFYLVSQLLYRCLVLSDATLKLIYFCI